MSNSTATKDKAPVEQPDVRYLNIRGKVYRIEEIEAGVYEEHQRTAEIKDEKGEGTLTDMVLLTKLVTLAATTIVAKEGDPAGEKLDPAAWAKEKYPVVSRVQLEVRRAHYMALTEQEIEQERKELEAQNRKQKADPNA